MKIYISHSGNYDYKNELYTPIKNNRALQNYDIFLPHEGRNTDVKTKDIVGSFDLILCEVSFPSTGQGIEIGLAAANDVSVICFYKQGAKPSGSLWFYSDQMIEYVDADDFVAKLSQVIRAKT